MIGARGRLCSGPGVLDDEEKRKREEPLRVDMVGGWGHPMGEGEAPVLSA